MDSILHLERIKNPLNLQFHTIRDCSSCLMLISEQFCSALPGFRISGRSHRPESPPEPCPERRGITAPAGQRCVARAFHSPCPPSGATSDSVFLVKLTALRPSPSLFSKLMIYCFEAAFPEARCLRHSANLALSSALAASFLSGMAPS